MKALTWQASNTVSVEEVPDPQIQEPTDAVIRVTSTAICGSDLHLYEVLTPFMDKGDIIGHEPMGIVEEIGSAVTHIKPGDRVVIPFNISCGHCFMCRQGLQSQCETTQVREYGTGAQFLGYSRLYGSVPGGQAEYLRVPHADYGAIKVPNVGEDERYLFLSDVVLTAWQAVDYAAVPDGGSLAVLGLGPIGQMSARIGKHLGYRVIATDAVPERRAMAERYGIETLDSSEDGVAEQLKDLTDGRGPNSVVDAVGMEAHGSPVASAVQAAVAAGPQGNGEGRSGPDECVVHRHRLRSPWRDDLNQRRVRRHEGPDADADDVRQADPAADGPVQRALLDRDAAAAGGRPVRSAGRARPQDAYRPVGGGASDVREVPEEAGRLHQGGAQTVNPGRVVGP
ncbi:hypothetical protein C629_00615 [Corynebacterium glutamicum SCgG2]|nr:hypothetical protein C624_00615 [Corynebacterium glutamicum SCgG1]AGN20737.1 hypothetical protein C629_00615 [Corynebacterium glutamicum SCgG2]NII88829.1 threonine dehydrogenase-like Zn-dependent dehydrogenase [Corynebacterium glutamicum]